MKRLIVVLTLLLAVYLGYNQIKKNLPMNVNSDAKVQLMAFKSKPKFKAEDENSYFYELQRPKLQDILTELLNQSADDFMKIIESAPSKKKFQDTIGIGLKDLIDIV